MPRSRQLAAIMFTDIKGYTALMQQNEEKALQARNKHRQVFNSTTEKYKGRILQYYGDGTLSIFDSAIDAVKCGIEMQLGFLEEPAIPVRIGIHTGEVFFSDEEIVGDSVNVASRIESLAVPGSVFVSDKVYDEIKNQKSILTTRLNTFKLKNVERPVEVFAISNPGLAVPRPEDIEGKTEPYPGSAPERKNSKLPEEAPPFLATKLFAPPPRPNIVQRSRLAERLDQGLHGKLTLISAPAGFGKTTLASEWAAGCGRAVAWLSLDEGDSNLFRFLTYFTAALQRVEEQIGEGVLRMLQSPQPPPSESILTALINEIASVKKPFVLILDDYHLIDSKPVDEALAFLLGHLPPQMHLAITTREDPGFPLARLRVRGQLAELRAADLRFTSEEAAGFLNQAMGLNLSSKDIAALEKRTEGWIAGLQMAALSMQGRADTDGFIKAFTGSHRFILDYLAEEVLQRQPEPIRRFLIQTAVLSRLCGPLCDAVTGQGNGREMLEVLEKGNLFVAALDDDRRWYRYHHLFADVLQARLAEELPGQPPVLHLRASEWYEAHDSMPDAIRHALSGNNFERAAGLIERAWPEMDSSFQSAIWLSWVEKLPEALLRNRPVLLVGFAWAFINEGELEAGEARIQEAEKWLEAHGEPENPPQEMVIVDEEQFRSLPGSIAVAHAYLALARNNIPDTVKFARQAIDRSPKEDYIRRGQASALLGLTHWASGSLEPAQSALSDTMSYFQMSGNIEFAISVTYGMADICITQGRLYDAIRTYKKALQLVEKQEGPVPPGTADLYLGLGALSREQGALEAAARQFSKSEELGAPAALPDWPCRLCLAKAALQESLGNLNSAIALLEEAEGLYFRTPVPNIRPIPALKARVWARQGRLREALGWARERGLSVDGELSFLNEFEYLTLARVLITRHRSGLSGASIEKAIKLLGRLLKAAEEGNRTGSAIEILIQLALAYAALDDTPRALAALERALAMAEPEGFIRIFADEGDPMAQLLSRIPPNGPLAGYIRRLTSAIEEKAAGGEEALRPNHSSSASPLIEPLSQRELEILQLIARGLSNREISERLFLALSTVKGHNQNIFAKLNVQRRTEAVARARELGLL
ncbi:MAG: tetratricopeptide repeat protein [Lewinellaceae bacterium]|nr:tetratricopeptide repeat protein [Lewinellaceae bacterium]